MIIEPFDVPSFTPQEHSELQARLKKAVYPHELKTNVGWKYGAPRWAVEPLVKAWLEFDWEKPRAEMTKWRHFRAEVNGLKVHFIHEISKQPDAIPLMLLHGWPSSFYEFHKIIEPLRDGEDGKQAFHLVIPSLPGYGFSDPPTEPGWGIAKMGDTMDKLMVGLGYTNYALHGTDWGAIIGKYLATVDHSHCAAFHSTFPLFAPPTMTISLLVSKPFHMTRWIASRWLGLDAVYGKMSYPGPSFVDATHNPGAGYRAIQSTKPYTLAYALSDSPIGILSWMLEKYHEWTHHEKDKEANVLPDTIEVDEFLTQVSLYWLTNSMSSSIRLYYERFHESMFLQTAMMRARVPTGVSLFKSEVARVPRDWIEIGADIVQYSEYPLGGHFSALEEPKLVVHDLKQFGKKVRSVVVKGYTESNKL